jgi:hypothetical protein
MGKTCPTYRMLMEDEISSWLDYRKALRREDQEAFDEIMNSARNHASASQIACRMNPFETMIMSALIDLMKGRRTGASDGITETPNSQDPPSV